MKGKVIRNYEFFVTTKNKWHNFFMEVLENFILVFREEDLFIGEIEDVRVKEFRELLTEVFRTSKVSWHKEVKDTPQFLEIILNRSSR